jgi:type II secretory pathway component PulK
MLAGVQDGRERAATDSNHGVALLAVLWLTMALSLIAFSTAYVVRTESAVTSNQRDIQRAYFMARGGVDRAIYEIILASRNISRDEAEGAPDEYRPGRRWMEFRYTQGRVLVQVVPENAKLSINSASVDSIKRLFEESGKAPDESSNLANAILDWRSTKLSSQESVHDQYYADSPVPIVPNHSPMQDLEEILYVRGMTTELFYGGSVHVNAAPGPVVRCLPDLLTVLLQGPINLNFASAEVMATMPGWDRALANLVTEGRHDSELINRPYRTMDDLVRRVPSIVYALGVSSVTLNSGDTYTLIATGQVFHSQLVRTVRAIVRIDSSRPTGYQTLGWWDDWPWSSPPDTLLKDSTS